ARAAAFGSGSTSILIARPPCTPGPREAPARSIVTVLRGRDRPSLGGPVDRWRSRGFGGPERRARLLQELGDQRTPPGLMARPQAVSVLTVKVLVEQQQVTPGGVVLEQGVIAVDRAPTTGVPYEETREAMREFHRHLPERPHRAGARGALDAELLPEVVVEPLQRLDQQEVERQPDGPAPVRVASE